MRIFALAVLLGSGCWSSYGGQLSPEMREAVTPPVAAAWERCSSTIVDEQCAHGSMMHFDVCGRKQAREMAAQATPAARLDWMVRHGCPGRIVAGQSPASQPQGK